MPLLDDMGLPLNESLPMLVNKLNEYGLYSRVKVISSGKLVTPADVAWALCLGANFVTSARGFMFALGCIQALQCNKDTCPTGITTHDKRLQRGLNPQLKSIRVASYVKNIVHEVGMIAHSCGVNHPRELDRRHARVVQANGLSVPLNVLYPVENHEPLVERRNLDTRPWSVKQEEIDEDLENTVINIPLKQLSGKIKSGL